MSKQTEKLKKQLVELSEAVNAFNSEDVQLKIIDRVLTHLTRQNNLEEDLDASVQVDDKPALVESTTVISKKKASLKAGRKPGVSLILQQLLNTDYFDTGKTLPVIAEYINAQFDSGEFYTNQISGILLGLVTKGKLIRTVGDYDRRYVYLKPIN